MAADPQRQEAPTDDLFGRWLAHHEQQSAEQGAPAGSSEGTPQAESTPRTSRRLPTAAVASSAVERDPMIGSRIVPPSRFGTRRPAANAPGTGSVNELDREPPAGWEPIVMRSVRTRAEKEEQKKTPKPIDRPSRLQRIKARLVDPAPEIIEEVEAEPVAIIPPVLPTPILPTSPVRAAAPAPVTRSIEETIRAAVAPAEPVVARHAQSDEPVEPVQPLVARHAQAVEPVAPLEVQPVARTVEPEELASPTPVRAFIDAPRIAQPEPVVVEPEPVAVVVEPEPVAVAVAVEPEPYVAPEPVAVEPEPAPYVAPEPVAVVAEPEPVAVAVAVEPAVVEAEPEPVVVEPVVVEVEPEPVVVEPVVVEVEPEREVARVTEIEPEPIAPQDLPESGFDEPEEPAARRSFLPKSLRQLKEAKPAKEPKEPREVQEPREPRPARTPRATSGDAARDLVAAKARARAAAPPRPLPEVEPEAPAPIVAEVAPEPEVEAGHGPLKVSSHDEVATQMPGVYTFTPKRTARRVLTIAFLIGAVVSANFVRGAIEIKDTPSIGLATIAVLTTAMLWAIRAGASVTKLVVHQGQLEVVQQGSRFVFDLASQYTAIEVRGEPGRRGWKVLFPRRGMAPFTVDASMVDPDDFMRVLRFFRPQLVSA